MRTTQLRLVVGLLCLGGVAGWTTVTLFRVAARPLPGLPWTVPGALLFFAGALAVGAWYMYDRVHRRRIGVDPTTAVRLLAMAKASALVGSLIAGWYVGLGLRFWSDEDLGVATGHVVRGLLAGGAGVLVVVAGLLLEQACKVPRDRNGDRTST